MEKIMWAIIICVIIGVFVGLLFTNSIPIIIIIGIVTVFLVTIFDKIIKKHRSINQNEPFNSIYEISYKINSLIPLIGTNVKMNEGENEYFTEDDSLYYCKVINGILEEISATISGETIAICNAKINIIKKYLKENNFSSSGKMGYDIYKYETFGNNICFVEIHDPKKEHMLGYTSLLLVKKDG